MPNWEEASRRHITQNNHYITVGKQPLHYRWETTITLPLGNNHYITVGKQPLHYRWETSTYLVEICPHRRQRHVVVRDICRRYRTLMCPPNWGRFCRHRRRPECCS